MHARLDAGRVQILTGRGNHWTDKYPAIAKSIAGLPACNAYLDGKLCGMLPDGKGTHDSGRAISHSMTSSARARIDAGTVRPSAFAVLRLRNSSNVVGCLTGAAEETDHRHRRLLRAGSERQRHRRATEKRDEIAPT
jgi:ATP-dependent DNA ligase